jgi:hypothetical protein
VDESLIGAIHAAFPDGVPPERPVTGHRCKECDEVDVLLGGRLWSDVTHDFPEYCHDTFPLLTPAAKVYYLPAYMCYEVRSPGHTAGLSVEWALESGDLQPAEFAPAQRSVILRWAELYYRREPEGQPPQQLVDRWRDGTA